MRKRERIKKKIVYQVGKVLAVSVLAALLAVGLYQLPPGLIPLLLLFFIPGVAVIAKQIRKKQYQDKRFEQCMDYLQQLIFSFEKTGELTASLKEVRQFYGEEEMGQGLDEALDYLDATYSANSKEVALQIIEEKFPCKPLKMVHKFLLEAETTGGKTQAALDILKEELKRYRTRMKLFQTTCQKTRLNIGVAVVAGMLLCLSLLYLTPDAGVLTGYKVYQAGTVLLCVISLGILCGDFILTGKDWLKEEERYSPQELEKKLLKYLNNSGKIGRKTLKSILQKEIRHSFPEWILKLTLLLQNRDVAGAMEESIKDADVVLKYYLQKLAEDIHDQPDSPVPYLNFLEEFKTPETENAMKILYAISTGGCADADKQLAWLFDRTQVMEEEAAKSKQENQMAKLYVLFLAPTLLSSLKLVVDLSLLLVSFMGQMGM